MSLISKCNSMFRLYTNNVYLKTTDAVEFKITALKTVISWIVLESSVFSGVIWKGMTVVDM